MPLPVITGDVLRERRAELTALAADGQYHRLTKRLLDFAQDFASGTPAFNEAVVLAGESNRLAQSARVTGILDETKSTSITHRALELADELDEKARHELQAVASSPSASVPPAAPETHPGTSRTRREPVEVRSTPREAVPRVQVEHVTRAYRRATLPFTLTDISFSLNDGEILGIVGPNGSGKTTLLRILTGALALDLGRLAYAFSPQHRWSDIKRKIAIIEQHPRSWAGTVREALLFTGATHGLPPAKNRDTLDFALGRLGLERFAASKWKELSIGFQMRVELARALMWAPELIVLDEPLAPLDIIAQLEFLTDLVDIARSMVRPTAVVLSSQHIDEIESIADRLLVLQDGRQRFYGTRHDVETQLSGVVIEAQWRPAALPAFDSLRQYGLIKAETLGTIHRLTFNGSRSRDEIIQYVTNSCRGLVYLRDITGSARRMFTTHT